MAQDSHEPPRERASSAAAWTRARALSASVVLGRVRAAFLLALPLAAMVGVAAASGGVGNAGPDLAADRADRVADKRGVRPAPRPRTPQAARRQRRSRTAYQRLSATEALRLARRSFGEVAKPAWRGVGPIGEQGVRRFLGDYAAQVQLEGGNQAFVASPLPLRTTTPDGRSVPVDLGLQRKGQGYVPRASLVKTRIARSARGGVRVGSLGVRPVGARNVKGTVVADKLFYADIGGAKSDTDLLIAPRDLGAEVYWQLRSQASPSRQALVLDLPRGAAARRSPRTLGALEIVRSGRVIASIDPPRAWDADRAPVHVRYKLVRNKVTVRVSHRRAPVRYPVLVDPGINVIEDFWPSSPPGYSFSRAESGWRPQNYGDWNWQDYWDLGLHHSAKPWVNYVAGNWVNWVWDAPPSTYIYRADYMRITYTARSWSGSTQAKSCMEHGIWNRTGSWWDGNGYAYKIDTSCATDKSDFTRTICASSDCSHLVGTDGNQAVQSLLAVVPGEGNSAFLSLGRAVLWLRDRHRPRITSTSHQGVPDPPVWLPEGVTLESTPTGTDKGLGVGRFELVARNSGSRIQVSDAEGNPRYMACHASVQPHSEPPPGEPGPDRGDRRHRCVSENTNPSTISTTFRYNTDQVPEGTKLLGADVYDIVGNKDDPPASSWTVKVDRSAPSALNPSGALYQPGGKWFKEGSHRLTLQPTDSHSGVRSSELQVRPGPMAVDRFTRTTPGSWGVADLGGAWSIVGDPTGFSVDGARAKIAAPQNIPLYALLNSSPAKDVDVRTEVSYPGPAGAGDDTAWLVLRRQTDGQQYRVGLMRDDLTQRLFLRGEPTGALFDQTDTGLTYEPGARYNVRARIDGDGSPDNETRVRARVWKVGAPEPASWTVDGFDQQVVGPRTAGVVGLAVESSTPGGATIEFDDLFTLDLGGFRTASPHDDGCGNQGCNTSPVHHHDWQTSEYPEGGYEFRAVARDPLAHDGGAPSQHTLTGSPWRVDLDRTPPRIIAKRGALAGEDGAIRRGSNDLTVAAGDSPSGVTRIEAFVSDADQPGSPRTSIGSKSCPDDSWREPDNCPALTGEFQWDASQSTWNRVRVAVEIRDKADNLTAKDWVVAVRGDNDAPLVNPSLAVWDHRNQDGPGADHRDEGVYDQLNPLRIVATDDGDPAERTGVRSIEILMKREIPEAPEEDFVRKDYVEYLCLLGRCRDSETRDWTFDADSVADGDYAVRVVARDLAGNQSVKDWQVTVDRRGDIYKASQYTATPPDRGDLVAEEWARIGTHFARHQDQDYITTRSTVPCRPNEQDSPPCGQVRYRSRFGEADPAETDTYTTYTGAEEEDERLDLVADMLVPANTELGAPRSRGPLVDVMFRWQRPPPAHGASYELYEIEESGDADGDGNPDEVTRRFWVDERTKLPVREAVVVSTETVAETYYVYDRGRLEVGEVPVDFFDLPRPAKVDEEKTVKFKGNDPVGPTGDQQTNSVFRPYYLGPSPALLGHDLCLATSNTVRQGALASDPDEADLDEDGSIDLNGPITYVTAHYNTVSAASACFPGIGEFTEPAFTVRSMAKSSSYAQAFHDQYEQTGTAIELDPTDEDYLRSGRVSVALGPQPSTAYILRIDDENSGALIVYDETTVEIVGPFDKESVDDVAAQLTPR